MSYQPPFDGNWMRGHSAYLTGDTRPRSVQTAVNLIYAGAVIEAISAAYTVATIGVVKSIILRVATTPLTTSQLSQIQDDVAVFVVIEGLIGIVVWLWMARKNYAGRRWARILSTVFFALLTLGELAVVAEPISAVGKLLAAANWIVAFGAIVLLWQRESSEFFRAQSHRYY